MDEIWSLKRATARPRKNARVVSGGLKIAALISSSVVVRGASDLCEPIRSTTRGRDRDYDTRGRSIAARDRSRKVSRLAATHPTGIFWRTNRRDLALTLGRVRDRSAHFPTRTKSMRARGLADCAKACWRRANKFVAHQSQKFCGRPSIR